MTKGDTALMDQLRQRARINRTQLELECSEQPHWFYQAGRLKAEAKAEASRCKVARDWTRANVETDIRKNPEAHGLVKVTEASVQAAVTLDGRTQQAETDLIEAERVFHDLTALRDAWEQRRSMLSDEVDMRIQESFGSPVGSPQQGRMSPQQQADRLSAVHRLRERAAEQEASQGE